MMRELLFLALLGYVRCQSINADGTPVDAGMGGTESIWTTTDAAGPKIYAGINCHTSLSAADDITIDFRVYQTHFDTDTGPWYYNWTNCESVDTAMATAAVGPMAVEATGCKATVSGDKAQYFTFSQTLSVTGDSAAPPCGGTYTGTVWKFAMRCQRFAGYDADYDRIFVYSCDQADNTNTLITTLSNPMVQVGKIPHTETVRRYEVLFEAIESTAVPNPLTDVPVAAAVDLGASLWLRWTLKIRSPDDTRTMFDMNGLGPICLSPYTCVAQQLAPDHTEDPSDPDRVDAATNPVTIIDANGCGTFTPIAQQFENLRPKYIKNLADGAEAMMFSPNHWYIGAFEAVSFLGKNIQLAADPATRKMLITCSMKYGYKRTPTTGELDCFGGGTGVMTDAGYPVCPGPPTASRKRRSDETNVTLDLELPETVSTVIEIKLDSGDKDKSSGFPKCIANTTFYALTGVLAALLLVVLAIGGYLTLKLRRVLNDRDSENSMTGIPNKAYY